MIRAETIEALAKMGVVVPDEWDDERVASTYAELQEAAAAEPARRWKPGSPRG